MVMALVPDRELDDTEDAEGLFARFVGAFHPALLEDAPLFVDVAPLQTVAPLIFTVFATPFALRLMPFHRRAALGFRDWGFRDWGFRICRHISKSRYVDGKR
jgi:hypothetical protein